MSSLKEIRNRIASVKNTQQITNAMKMVSAAKLRKAQTAIQQIRPYARKLHDITQHVSDSMEESSAFSKYFEERDLNRVLIVPMTADKGLCGAFNSNVQKQLHSVVKKQYSQLHKAGKVDLMCIGKRGYESLKKQDYSIVDAYTNFFNKPTYEESNEIANRIINWYSEGTYDRVIIIYNWFKNAATYFTQVQQFLPITSMEDLGHQSRATDLPSEDQNSGKYKYDYIFDPSKEGILQNLVPKSLQITFYKDVLDSSAAEHGSRMTAMDNATENAEELVNDLQLQYNKARQAAITKELSEIVGGAEALAG
jgi:F-type H+-transporting ATPase subunit gamma